MKHYFFSIILVGFVFPNLLLSQNGTKKISVNVSESTIRWDGYKVLGSHYGSVNLQSGELLFDDDLLTGGHFVMDMRTIQVEDLEGDSRVRLENHLKSDDFFGVENYPSAEFRIEKVSTGNEKGMYNIEGNLTIKGNSHPLHFVANVEQRGENTVAAAKIQIDRSKFDIKYRSGSFFSDLGDRAIYDNFDLTVSLVAEDEIVN